MKNILSIVVISILLNVYGQNEYHYYKPNITPSSPEESALLKYLETPVSPSNGTTGINIPLYSIDQGGINFPINLTYNSSGIRVTEVSSSVGLGWNLNIPKIVRVVRGAPDDFVNGFIIGNQYTVEYVKSISECLSWDPTNPNQCDYEMQYILTKIKQNAIDLESDLYSASLPSGEVIQFMFNQNRSSSNPYGEIVTFPKSYVKIKPIVENNKISSWEIIDTNGVKYIFAVGNSSTAGKSYTYGGDLPSLGTPYTYSYFSSWNISQIIDTNNETLDFSYQTKPLNSNCYFTNQLWNTEGLLVNNNVKNEEINHVIQDISGDFGSIKFYNSPKDDYDGSFKIHKMEIYPPSTSIPFKTINLEYQYSIDNSIPNNIIYCDKVLNSSSPERTQLASRMFLKNVTFQDKSLNQNGIYQLIYNDETLPHRFSFSQDWWGYYNGKTNNSLAYNPKATYGDQSWNNFNRNIDQEKSQAGILKKIIYPTGGATEFEYENNRGIFTHRGILYHLNNPIPNLENIEQFIFSNGNTDWEIIENQVIYDEIPFSIKDDVLNYHRKSANSNQLYIDVHLNVLYGSNNVCTGPIGDGLPQLDQCYSEYQILDSQDNIIYQAPTQANFTRKFSFHVGDIQSGLIEKDYKIRLIGYNAQQGPSYDPQTESIDIQLKWYVYDPTVVRHLELFNYEIPIGGIRTKKVTHLDNLSNVKMIKEYSFKDSLGIESGIYNVNLDYFQAVNRIPTVNSNNSFPLQTSGTNIITYTRSKETIKNYLNPSENIESTFNTLYYSGTKNYGCHYMEIPEIAFTNSKSTPCFQHPKNGKLEKTTLGNEKVIEYAYNNNGGILFQDVDLSYVSGIDYNVPILFNDIGFYGGFCSVNCLDGLGTPAFLPFEDYFYYVVNQFYDEPTKKVTTTTHLNEDIIETTLTEYHPDYPFLPIKNETVNSFGETLTTEYKYPQDLPSEPLANQLVLANRISQPLKTVNKNGSTIISETKTKFNEFTVSESPLKKLILPEFIYAKRGEGITSSDLKITYNRYDSHGNLQQYTLADGTPVSIIWGYNGQYPIAKVEGVAYTTIASEAEDLADLSDGGTLIESSFENLLNTSGALVTCYIYEPLVGVKMIIQPNGQKEIYHYDEAGRLKFIKDHDGNVLKELEYHYFNQP